MRHLQFKSSQTAAIYVADGLEAGDREEFELHLMRCPECVEDVETWRALQQGIRTEQPARPASLLRQGSTGSAAPAAPVAGGGAAAATAAVSRWNGARHWQIAASAVLAACLGAFGGWFLHTGHATMIDDDSIALTSLGPLTRGTDCSVARLSATTRIVALRIPGAQPGTRLVATRLDGSALAAGEYSVRVQPDQSWLVRLAGSAIIGHEVALATETGAVGGNRLALGCVAAVVAP